jgi:hypothetical protein
MLNPYVQMHVMASSQSMQFDRIIAPDKSPSFPAILVQTLPLILYPVVPYSSSPASAAAAFCLDSCFIRFM